MRRHEDGSALVLSLLLILALSVVGASIATLSITESYGSVDYRLLSQARYSAESGVQKTANYLLNMYVPPTTGGADPISVYDLTKSPVTVLATGQPVVLSANNAVAANYPVAVVQTAFQAAGAGTLAAGSGQVTYAASATLLSMQQISVYGSATPVTIQTWQITSDGSVGGLRTAQVEVSSTLERQTATLGQYAAFASASGCGALTFSGGAIVDSYDSKNIVKQNGSVVTQQSGGNIGANGNLNESGGATIYGTMSTPRSGVGNCSAGGVSAWSDSGGATVTGGLIQLPQALAYPSVTPPNPLPPTTNVSISSNTTCTGITGCTPGVPSGLAFAPGSYGNISVSGGANLHLSAGSYAINSLQISGGATLVIDSGPIVVNLAGQNVVTVVSMSGGAMTNASLDPSWLQFQYSGSGTISVSGGATSAAVVYAPNAAVSLSGGIDWYGSLIGQTINASGGMHIHNDRELSSEFFTVGNPMLTGFTWKKY